MPFLPWKVLALFAISLIILSTLRFVSILPWYRSRPKRRSRNRPVHIMVVLGSGGHTAEMIAMLSKSAHVTTSATSPSGPAPSVERNTHLRRTWVISSGDAFSATRAKEFEKAQGRTADSYNIISVTRARKIHQPLLTTPISALQCLCSCLLLLATNIYGHPDLIITNGPATGTILVLASFILRFFDIRSAASDGRMRTIYVESWARVKKLSLSGRLLCWMADRVLVQWPQLEGAQGRGEYLGVLV